MQNPGPTLLTRMGPVLDWLMMGKLLNVLLNSGENHSVMTELLIDVAAVGMSAVTSGGMVCATVAGMLEVISAGMVQATVGGVATARIVDQGFI